MHFYVNFILSLSGAFLRFYWIFEASLRFEASSTLRVQRNSAPPAPLTLWPRIPEVVCLGRGLANRRQVSSFLAGGGSRNPDLEGAGPTFG